MFVRKRVAKRRRKEPQSWRASIFCSFCSFLLTTRLAFNFLCVSRPPACFKVATRVLKKPGKNGEIAGKGVGNSLICHVFGEGIAAVAETGVEIDCAAPKQPEYPHASWAGEPALE